MNNIQFPDDWKKPIFKLGQHVKQGQIVGIEYHPPGTMRAYKYGEGWDYWVIVHELEDYIENFREESLEPLTAAELQASIDKRRNLIETYQKRIAAIRDQMKEVEAPIDGTQS